MRFFKILFLRLVFSFISSSVSEKLLDNPEVGDVYQAEAIIDLKNLGDTGIGVDFVSLEKDKNNNR